MHHSFYIRAMHAVTVIPGVFFSFLFSFSCLSLLRCLACRDMAVNPGKKYYAWQTMLLARPWSLSASRLRKSSAPYTNICVVRTVRIPFHMSIPSFEYSWILNISRNKYHVHGSGDFEVRYPMSCYFIVDVIQISLPKVQGEIRVYLMQILRTRRFPGQQKKKERVT